MAAVNPVTRTIEISFDALNEVSSRILFLAESLRDKTRLDRDHIEGLAAILRDLGEYVGCDLRSEHDFRYRVERKEG